MIQAISLSKSFGSDAVLQGLTFSLEEGETLSVLGKSGCGKTTLLKIMAGLEQADSGRLLVEGREVLSVPPQQRGMVYLSQEPLLFPHLAVYENIAFGLEIRKIPKALIQKEVQALLSRLGLLEHAKKMPQQLSGGQRQRVAFGRALAIKPRLLLLDEPFGSLDAHTRREMQALFREVSLHLRMTALFVTHDLREALTMGDKAALMDKQGLRIFPQKQDLLQEPDFKEEVAFWKGLLG